MLQYEFAYDSAISTTNYQDIQLSWFTNYYGVSNISLGGSVEGTMTSTIGAASAQSNLFSALANGGQVAGKAIFAGIGSQFLTKNTKDATTGANKLGLPNGIFQAAVKGITGALSGAVGGIPTVITNVFSAIFGGSSAGSTTTFNLNATMTLNGTNTSGGSFPSSPTSVWVPGSIISPLAQNYIPLYNEPLGVFNLTSKPVVNVNFYNVQTSNGGRPPVYNSQSKLEILPSDNSERIQINPSVAAIADISIDQEWLIKPLNKSGTAIKDFTGVIETIGEETYYTKDSYFYSSNYQANYMTFEAAVRITVKVTPKDGSPASLIVKTFKADVVNHH